MSMLLSKKNVESVQFCGDATRPTINGLIIKDGQVISTNGHLWVETELPDPKLSSDFPDKLDVITKLGDIKPVTTVKLNPVYLQKICAFWTKHISKLEMQIKICPYQQGKSGDVKMLVIEDNKTKIILLGLGETKF